VSCKCNQELNVQISSILESFSLIPSKFIDISNHRASLISHSNYVLNFEKFQ
jgi:hypothetical protein